MNKIRWLLFSGVIFYQSSVMGLKRDALVDLAESQSLPQLLQANQKADRVEILQALCRRQIKQRHWPVHCWEWLDMQIAMKEVSNKKQMQWQNYLNNFCKHLTQRTDVPSAKRTSLRLWHQSHCGVLAKKFGPSLEEEGG